MTATAVWLTLFTEIAGPFLLWTRLRWLIILLATAMHAVIGVIMGLNLFELLMVVMLLAFLPDRVIRDRFRGGANLAKLTLTFNPQQADHARAAALAVANDIDNQIALVPAASATSVELIDPDKASHTGTEGVSAYVKHVRLPALLRFVLWVPGLRGLLAAVLFPKKSESTREVKAPTTATRSPAAK
jgi:hypothetical protein